jgi:DNA primase
VLAFDNDAAGRDGISRAVDAVTRAKDAPELRVLEPKRLGDAKDPDEFVRRRGAAELTALVEQAECAVGWRAREFVAGVTPADDPRRRREALRRAGAWLGSLPSRLALEQEDALRQVADQCGYSREGVERAFRARYCGRSATRPRSALAIER